MVRYLTAGGNSAEVKREADSVLARAGFALFIFSDPAKGAFPENAGFRPLHSLRSLLATNLSW